MSFDPSNAHTKALLRLVPLALEDAGGACALPVLLEMARAAGYSKVDTEKAINWLARAAKVRLDVMTLPGAGRRTVVVEAL